MPLSRGIWVGIAATAAFALLGVLLFFQTKDPMVLIFPVWLAVPAWVVVLIVHVLRKGIPVRIVSDERRER